MRKVPEAVALEVLMRGEMREALAGLPQRLKPVRLGAPLGTAEAVPLRKAFCDCGLKANAEGAKNAKVRHECGG